MEKLHKLVIGATSLLYFECYKYKLKAKGHEEKMYEHNEDTVAIIDLTRKLVEKHQRPLERRVLRGETLTDEDFHAGTQEAKELGLWGLTAPDELGGAGISVVDYLSLIHI